MNIKSNSKHNGPSIFKRMWNGFRHIIPSMTLFWRIVTFVLFGFLSYQMWQYSGIVSTYIMILGLMFLFTGMRTEDRVIMGIISAIILFGFSNVNVYFIKPDPINVKYSKVAFTDSTEKMVVHMTYPIKEVLVLGLSDKHYYTAKEFGKDFNLTISESGAYDHFSKLLGNNTIEEYNYTLTAKAGEFKYENTQWRTSKTPLFKDKK